MDLKHTYFLTKFYRKISTDISLKLTEQAQAFHDLNLNLKLSADLNLKLVSPDLNLKLQRP